VKGTSVVKGHHALLPNTPYQLEINTHMPTHKHTIAPLSGHVLARTPAARRERERGRKGEGEAAGGRRPSVWTLHSLKKKTGKVWSVAIHNNNNTHTPTHTLIPTEILPCVV